MAGTVAPRPCSIINQQENSNMEYVHIGKSGLRVSRLCLGTANFGIGGKEAANFGTVDKEEALRILDAARDAGINFIDTANTYGSSARYGYSEELIGEWFKQGDGRRERTVLATKVGRFVNDAYDYPVDTEYARYPSMSFSLSKRKVRSHLEASLKRLGTDHVDILEPHRPYNRITWDEFWDSFRAVVDAGMADYIGSSNFSALEIMNAQFAAKERRHMGLVSEQHRYDLLGRHAELEVIPTVLDRQMGLTIQSPLARGLLGTDMFDLEKRALSDTQKHLINYYHDQLVAFSTLCRDLGEKEAAVSIAWILSNPAVTSVIIGPCSTKDLEELVRATEIKLDADVLKRLNEIFPPVGAGGPAPYAYSIGSIEYAIMRRGGGR